MVIVPSGVRTHIETSKLSEEIENPEMYGLVDGGLRHLNAYVESAEQLSEALIIGNRNFYYGGSPQTATWYSLNKRKRWTLFENLVSILEEKKSAATKITGGAAKNPSCKHANDVGPLTEESAHITPIRVVISIPFHSISKLNRLPHNLLGIAYCDSHAPGIHAEVTNSRRKVSMRKLRNEAFAKDSEQKLEENNVPSRCSLAKKRKNPHHNQHCRALKRPYLWKLERAAQLKRCAN